MPEPATDRARRRCVVDDLEVPFAHVTRDDETCEGPPAVQHRHGVKVMRGPSWGGAVRSWGCVNTKGDSSAQAPVRKGKKRMPREGAFPGPTRETVGARDAAGWQGQVGRSSRGRSAAGREQEGVACRRWSAGITRPQLTLGQVAGWRPHMRSRWQGYIAEPLGEERDEPLCGGAENQR
jgi:hypothetical protein